MTTVLGIDLGTQSVKVVVYDADKREPLAVASSPLELRRDKYGAAEQQANWWLAALRAALAGIPADIRSRIQAVGVSGQQHGFVPLDAGGKVLTPVKLWCDTSTGEHVRNITNALGSAAQCIEAAGNPVLVGYTASKVRWLKDQHPSLYSELATILLPHDYLNFCLTGERCMEAGDASGTGFFDVRRRRWSDELLSAIDPERDLKECLPDVRLDNEAIGCITETAAKDFGLPAGIPVSVGGGDNMMGAIGTGNVSPGRVTMSLGTSGTVYAYSDAPVIDPAGEIAAFCSSTGGWLPLLCTMNCTIATELFRKLLDTDIDSFETRIASASRGSGGIVTVPFFNGERTPNLPNAKGMVIGLDSGNTNPENLLRSAVEGATFALRAGIDRLRTLGSSVTEIVVTGGGANSPTWRQLVADICDAPVVVLKNQEGAALGAALQALAMLEGERDWAALAARHLDRDASLGCEPQPAAVDDFATFFSHYGRAVSHTAQLYETL